MTTKQKIFVGAITALLIRDEVTLIKNSKLDKQKSETIHNLVDALESQQAKIEYLAEKLIDAGVPPTEFDMIVLNELL